MEQELISEKQSSIAIEKNSKGYNWSIKLYYDADTTEYTDIIAKLKAIDGKLRNEFN